MKTMTGTISVSAGAGATRTNLVARLIAVAKNLDWRLERQRGRRRLGELTDDELHDVGLTRDQARSAATKHLFQD